MIKNNDNFKMVVLLIGDTILDMVEISNISEIKSRIVDVVENERFYHAEIWTYHRTENKDILVKQEPFTPEDLNELQKM